MTGWGLPGAADAHFPVSFSSGSGAGFYPALVLVKTATAD